MAAVTRTSRGFEDRPAVAKVLRSVSSVRPSASWTANGNRPLKIFVFPPAVSLCCCNHCTLCPGCVIELLASTSQLWMFRVHDTCFCVFFSAESMKSGYAQCDESRRGMGGVLNPVALVIEGSNRGDGMKPFDCGSPRKKLQRLQSEAKFLGIFGSDKNAHTQKHLPY